MSRRIAAVEAPPGALRVAVFGLGRDGLASAATLAMREGCALVALGDPRGDAVRRAHGVGFAVPGYARLERLMVEASPQVLVVAVPLERRAAAVQLALEAGIAVLAEPPIAPSAAEVEPLAKLAAERRLALAVAHRLPFEPTFAHAARELGSGALGALLLARSSVYASRVFSAQDARATAAVTPGGVMVTEALDLVLMLDRLFGTPVSVQATTSPLYGGAEDEGHAMMELSSGAEVGLDASWSVPGYVGRACVVEAEGGNGVVLISDDAYEIELREPRTGLPAGHRRVRDGELDQPARFDVDGEARDPMIAAFLEWVRGGAEPLHAAVHALRAQRTLDAMLESARRGGAKVQVGPA